MTEAIFKAALWSAVSSAAQAAADKISLQDQLDRERATCAVRNWQIVSELVVAGHSREYTSLDAGMRDIPELRQLLDLARDGAINLALVYDTNRFRGLQAPIIKTLMHYGVQVYSLTQPMEPVAPGQFSYFRSDTPAIMSHIGALLSDIQISSLRRMYDNGMPARVERGLHFNNHLPFGYRKPPGRELDHQVVAEIVPAQAALLLEAKRMYEAGHTGREIADFFNTHTQTERGKRFTHTEVAAMLFNPWYAGLSRRGRRTIRRDVLTGKNIGRTKPREEWVLRKGGHQALWSREDYERLWELRLKRAGRMTGATKSTHLFSHLMVCAQCGSHMRVSRALRSGETSYACSQGASKAGHGRVRESVVVAEVQAWLQVFAAAAPAPAAEIPPAVVLELARIHKTLAENDLARVRYEKALGRGALSDEHYDARIAELDAERKTLEVELAVASDQRRRVERVQAVRANAALLLNEFERVLALPAAQANARLAMVIEQIVANARKITDISAIH